MPTHDAGGEGQARGGLGTVRNAVQLLELLSDGPAYQHLTPVGNKLYV